MGVGLCVRVCVCACMRSRAYKIGTYVFCRCTNEVTSGCLCVWFLGWEPHSFNPSNEPTHQHMVAGKDVGQS